MSNIPLARHGLNLIIKELKAFPYPIKRDKLAKRITFLVNNYMYRADLGKPHGKRRRRK